MAQYNINNIDATVSFFDVHLFCVIFIGRDKKYSHINGPNSSIKIDTPGWMEG